MIRICLSLLSITLLAGCAAGTLTVQTEPQGALIASGNRTLGVSPVTLTLPSESKNFPQDQNGCYLAPGFTAKWASGATASSPSPTHLCSGLKSDYVVDIPRPADAPGLKEDLAAANQRAQVLAKQQVAASINNLAETQAMDSMMYGGMYGMPYYPY